MLITLYITPPSLNDWMNLNPFKKARIKKQFEHDIYYLAYNQRPSEPYKKAHVKITIYFDRGRRRDLDNYSPKMLLDGLVKAKIIIDDRAEVIGQTEILFGRAGKARTEIEITEIATKEENNEVTA